MKHSSFLAIFVSLFIISCSQTEEPLYSCDDDVDNWISEHLDDVKSMSRSTWLNIQDFELQKSVYALFNAEQKYIIWTEHLKEVMTLDWNPDEMLHLKRMYDFIADWPELFNGRIDTMTDEDADTFEIFIYKWQEYAKENLNWSDATIYAIIASPEKMTDKQGSNQKPRRSPIIDNESGPINKTCDCSTESNWCDPMYHTMQCKSDGCKVTSNCGTFLKYDCNGRCYSYLE